MPWWRQALDEPVALGLVPLILLRPFSDGPTFPTNNLYWVVGIMALLAIWGARMLLRGETIRFATPLLLLLGFWIVGIITAVDTVQFDATYRTIIIWAGHLALFFIVLNGVRTRIGLGIVLTAVMVSFLTEATWSLIHYRYVLPFVRQSVMEDPSLRKAYFSSTELDPELIHRLEVNRAFGSLLFPNALGAFLILGIPLAAGGAVYSLYALFKRRGQQSTGEQPPAIPGDTSLAALVVGAATWIITLCILFFLFSFMASFEYPLPPGMERPGYLPIVRSFDGSYHADNGVYVGLWVLCVVIAPLAAGSVAAYTTRKYGLAGFALRFRALAFPVILLIELPALWLTYSRGSLAALAAAIVFLVGMLSVQRLRSPRLLKPALIAITALIGLTTLFSAFAEKDSTAPAEVGSPSPKAASDVGTAAGAGFGETAPTEPASGQPAPPPGPSIRTEGIDLTFKDLMNPASFKLRLSYWRTGFRMAAANLWTGVGLGNFGTAYPVYQPLDAGAVRAAHNDYLQAFCETGVFGGLLFCAFWAYFAIWGAVRVVRERDPMERWFLGGIYLGVLAFLIHSLVDFNFFNSALAFFAVLFTGLFFVRSGVLPAGGRGSRRAENPSAPAAHQEVRPRSSPPNGPPSGGVREITRRRSAQVLAIPLLISAAAVSGMCVPVYLCDFIIGGHSVLNVGDIKRINAVYDAGVFFFSGLGPANEPRKHAIKDVATVGKLIPNRKVVESFATIYVPVGDGSQKHRPLRPDEQVPGDAVVVVNNPQLARQKAQEYADTFLDNLAVIDAIFPHSPEWCAYFIQWYELLASSTAEPEARQRYIIEFLRWAEIGVKRSPEQAPFRQWHGRALWMRANIEKGPGRKQYFDKGLEEYKRATELYPISPDLWYRYGDALVKYGEALISAGGKAAGEARVAEGREATRYAKELERHNAST
jgi:O-antigen ligase